MNVKLLFHSPLWVASHAIRMSHDNHYKSDTTEDMVNGRIWECDWQGDYVYNFDVPESGAKDRELIARVGNKLKHKSVLEQLVYWFDIDGISRGCLQELARHRTARLTVKSSRYTLKQLKDAPENSMNNFLVSCGDKIADGYNFQQLQLLRSGLKEGVSNDKMKYMLPEAFKTRLQWQIDGRNLQNFLELRTSKDALWEIQNLARAIYDALPSEHRYLYEEYVK